MTLVAHGPEGERFDITEMPEDDWREIREQAPPIRCRGCGGKMHTREMHLSGPMPGDPIDIVRMFAHNPGEAERCKRIGGDESPEHDLLKTRLAAGARRAGWEAELEVWHEDDCRSDVVATNPQTGGKYALEAQLASLNTADALARHQRYVDAVGHCAWTHSGRREWSHRIPCLRVEKQEPTTVTGGIVVDLDGEREADPMPVADAIEGILTNRISYVYDGADRFGYFVERDALSSGTATWRPRRKERRARGGVSRFCRRVRAGDQTLTALAAYGWPNPADFIAAVDAMHERRAGGPPVNGEDMALAALSHLYSDVARQLPNLPSLPVDVIRAP